MSEEKNIMIADKSEVKSFAKSVRNWLSIELTIKIFGVPVIAWKFPPDSNTPVESK